MKKWKKYDIVKLVKQRLTNLKGEGKVNNNDLYKRSILLIGPSGAGKSTVAEELHKITKMSRLCLDVIANQDKQSGFMNNFKNADEYNAHMIKKVLEKAEADGIPGVVDFGAGHSVYEDLQIFNEVKRELKKFANIILLLPSVNIEESLQIMEQRATGDYSTNKKFIMSQCNRELATMTMYGNNRTPKQIAIEIIEKIKKRERNNSDIERE